MQESCSDLTLLPAGSAPAAGLTEALTSAAGYALGEKADATRRATLADIGRFSTWRQARGRDRAAGDAGDHIERTVTNTRGRTAATDVPSPLVGEGQDGGSRLPDGIGASLNQS